MVVDLLQSVGLNKYESEAYAALLEYGPLTGYELGKRSGVPLSRSYEILERLAAKGLALVQPGDPPRYAAEAPEQFVERTRAAAVSTLDTLARALAELRQPAPSAGFWVIRGQEHVLRHARTLIAQAKRTLTVYVAPAQATHVAEALAQARARGCRVVQPRLDPRAEQAATLLLVADDREGLVGTLEPANRAQAVASTNPAFVAALVRGCAPAPVSRSAHATEAVMPARVPQSLDWLEWEQRKQRGLLNVQPDNRIA